MSADPNADPASVMDHRRIGRELGVFTTDPLIGAGLPLWLPNGAAIRASLERFITDLERRAGYRHVYTPALAKRELYERSGHWAHYRESMFPPMQLGDEQFVLRPMNCPHHIIVYRSEQHSWRSLPYRVAELGAMYREERSGVVGGLNRVRAMTLNDAHIFCRMDQLSEEFAQIIGMIQRCYAALGIEAHHFRLSLGKIGDPKFVADAELWQRSEHALRRVLGELGIDYVEAPGEAAFYGPKVDVQVTDRLAREYTLSTVQLDFHFPQVFGLEYAGADGGRHVPVMVHRSILSTMERMVAHLLEQHGARLPLWLAPVHAVVLPVTAAHGNAAADLRDELVNRGMRAELDAHEQTLAARVRDAQRRQVPCMAIIGDREIADNSVALRLRDGRKHSSTRKEFVERLADAVSIQAREA